MGEYAKAVPLSEVNTNRKSVQKQALDLGVDIKGLSTRELKEQIVEATDAKNDLGDMISKEIGKLSRPINLKTPEETVTTRGSTDIPMNFNMVQPAAKGSPNIVSGGGGGGGIPIEFYCWKDGEVGTIILTASQDFEALPPA
jgi:hypothetical protein